MSANCGLLTLGLLAVAATLLVPLPRALALVLLFGTVADRFVPPMASLGSLEVRIMDAALLALAIRLALTRPNGSALRFPRTALPWAVLLWVALLSSLLSFPHFATGDYVAVMVAGVKLCWCVLLLPVAYSITRVGSPGESMQALFIVSDAQVAAILIEFASYTLGVRWTAHFTSNVGGLMIVRPVGLAGDPGVVVHVLAPFVLTLFAFLLLRTGLSAMRILRFALYGFAVLTTLSRGPLLGLVAGSGMVALATGGLAQALLILGIVTMVLLPVASPALTRLFRTVSSFIAGTLPGASTSEGQRMITWGLALEAFRDHPVLGLGWSGFGHWVKNLPGLSFIYGTTDARAIGAFTGSAYNQYLQVLVDLGFAGLASYLGALTSTAAALKRRLRLPGGEESRSYLVGGLGYVVFVAVVGLTDTWLISGSAATVTFFVLSGTLLATAASVEAR